MTGHPDKEFMKEMADTIETAAKEAEKLAEQGRGNQAPHLLLVEVATKLHPLMQKTSLGSTEANYGRPEPPTTRC